MPLEDISRFYLKNENSTRISRFLNVLTINKDDDFFEYKITLEGFPKGKLRISNGILSSVDGIKKIKGVKRLLKGDIEISYHKDGTTNYKDRGETDKFANLKPKRKFPSIKKLKKHYLLLRMTGFRTSMLRKITKKDSKKDHEVISLDKNLSNNFICCDIYISGRPIVKRDITTKLSDNQECFTFINKEETVALHLHFYTVKTNKFCFIIGDPSFLGGITRRYYYIKYKIIDFLKKMAHKV